MFPFRLRAVTQPCLEHIPTTAIVTTSFEKVPGELAEEITVCPAPGKLQAKVPLNENMKEEEIPNSSLNITDNQPRNKRLPNQLPIPQPNPDCSGVPSMPASALPTNGWPTITTYSSTISTAKRNKRSSSLAEPPPTTPTEYLPLPPRHSNILTPASPHSSVFYPMTLREVKTASERSLFGFCYVFSVIFQLLFIDTSSLSPNFLHDKLAK